MTEPTSYEREAVERERTAFEHGARYATVNPGDDYHAAAVFLYPLPMKPVQYLEDDTTGDGK